MRNSARFIRLRRPDDGAPDASAAPAAFGVSVGAALRTAALARAAEAAPAPAPAQAEPVPVAPAPEAPAQAAPAPATEASAPEVAAPESPAPSDPMAVLLAKLEALEAKLAGNPAPVAPEPAPEPVAAEIPAAPAPPAFKTSADIDKAEAETERALAWLKANRDGVEYNDAQGKPVRLTADQVDDEIDRLRDELWRRLPKARADLAAYRTAEAAARAAHPTHFDPRHPDHKAIAALFAEFPSLAGNHRLAAEVLRGRRALAAPAPQARPAAAPARAPIPPSAPVGEPVRAGVRTEPAIDRDRMARDGIGFGHLLRKR